MNRLIEKGSWVVCCHPEDKSRGKFVGQVTDMNGLYTGTIYVSCFHHTGVYLRDCELATQEQIENRNHINLFK